MLRLLGRRPDEDNVGLLEEATMSTTRHGAIDKHYEDVERVGIGAVRGRRWVARGGHAAGGGSQWQARMTTITVTKTRTGRDRLEPDDDDVRLLKEAAPAIGSPWPIRG